MADNNAQQLGDGQEQIDFPIEDADDANADNEPENVRFDRRPGQYLCAMCRDEYAGQPPVVVDGSGLCPECIVNYIGPKFESAIEHPDTECPPQWRPGVYLQIDAFVKFLPIRLVRRYREALKNRASPTFAPHSPPAGQEKGVDWQQCPRCYTQYNRSSGCNHMTCTLGTCHTHFCYLCGATVDYALEENRHWVAPTSNCPLYGRRVGEIGTDELLAIGGQILVDAMDHIQAVQNLIAQNGGRNYITWQNLDTRVHLYAQMCERMRALGDGTAYREALGNLLLEEAEQHPAVRMTQHVDGFFHRFAADIPKPIRDYFMDTKVIAESRRSIVSLERYDQEWRRSARIPVRELADLAFGDFWENFRFFYVRWMGEKGHQQKDQLVLLGVPEWAARARRLVVQVEGGFGSEGYRFHDSQLDPRYQAIMNRRYLRKAQRKLRESQFERDKKAREDHELLESLGPIDTVEKREVAHYVEVEDTWREEHEWQDRDAVERLKPKLAAAEARLRERAARPERELATSLETSLTWAREYLERERDKREARDRRGRRRVRELNGATREDARRSEAEEAATRLVREGEIVDIVKDLERRLAAARTRDENRALPRSRP